MLVALASVLALVPHASAAITRVQTTAKFRVGQGVSVTSLAFASNPVVGNRIIVLAFSWVISTRPMPTLTATDTAGNTYTVDVQVTGTDTVGSLGNNAAAILSAPVTATGANFKVTVTVASTNAVIVAVAMEDSGIGPKDQIGTNKGTTGSPTVSTTAATTAANERVSSVMSTPEPANLYTSITPGATFTERVKELDNSNYLGGEGADKIGGVAGLTQTNTWTVVAASTSWYAAIATYFPACVAVSDATYVAATAQSGQATIYWSSANPALVLRKAGAFAGEAPANYTTYTAGQSIGGATVAYVGSGPSFTQTGLTNGTTYSFKVFADTSGPSCYAPGGAGTSVTALPLALTSNVVWSYMLAGGSALKAPTSDDSGNVAFSSNARAIVSLAGTTGLENWAPAATTAAVQDYMVWTTFSGGGAGVFGGDQSGRVYSIAPSTGAANTNWPVALAAPADAVQAGVTIQIRAYADSAFAAAFPGTYDVVFAATANNTGAFTTNNKVVALRSDTGAVLWTFNPCSPGCAQNVDVILGQPWIDYHRNFLYVSSRAGAAEAQSSLWVLNSLTGAVLTSFALGNFETAPTASLDGNTFWVGNKGGNLYAFDLTGAVPTLKWTGPLALGSSAFTNGFVWEDSDTAAGRLYFTTANGALRCFQDPGVGGTPSAAAVCSGWSSPTTAVTGPTTALLLTDTVYVGSWTGALGRIVPINKLTGAAGTAFTVGDGTKQVGDMSTQSGNEIFIGTTEGKVFKISLPLP